MISNKKGRSSHLTPSRSASRRRMLTGGLVVGAALPFGPARWAAPVVRAVVLPAHAQTSVQCPVPFPALSIGCGDVTFPANAVSNSNWFYTLITFSLQGGCVTGSKTSFSYTDQPNAPDTTVGTNQVLVQVEAYINDTNSDPELYLIVFGTTSGSTPQFGTGCGSNGYYIYPGGIEGNSYDVALVFGASHYTATFTLTAGEHSYVGLSAFTVSPA